MLGERITRKIHELNDEKREQLICSIYCETSFDGGFFVELRKSITQDAGILYQFCEGPLFSDGSFHKSSSEYLFSLRNYRQKFSGNDEAMDYFNYRPHIKMIQLEDADYSEIMSLLKSNPLPDVKGELKGLDGHDIVFQSCIDCKSKYAYWVFPPKGYDHLRVVTNIISKYLEVPYCEWAYVKQNMMDL